jgi:hypothetical protein
MRSGPEGFRKQNPKPREEESSIADLFPPPKERRDEKGEVIPFIKPMRRELLRQEVQKRMDTGKDFGAAFNEAFNHSAFWKEGLNPEDLGAYAQAVHDMYGIEYRPQDDWFHKDIAPKMAEERRNIDNEHSPTKEDE